MATSLVAALAIGVLAMPTTAATKAKMVLVNGIPGTSIDVCVGTNEIKSNLAYGAAYKKQLVGTKALRFRKAAPGHCTGRLLAGKRVGFPSGADKSIVVTSKSPKVLVFDNAGLGTLPAAPAVSALAVRHAADLTFNSLHMHFRLWENVYDSPLTPSLAVDPLEYVKGMQFKSGLALSAARAQVVVTRPNDTTILRESSIFEIEALRRYEFYFVGTSAENARLVRVTSSLATAPTP
jgi:hypothetical protein